MNRFAKGAVLAAVTAFVAGTPACAQSGFTTELAIATFDTAWARIDRTYYDTAFLNTRWKVLRDSLRPMAQRATTNAQIRVVLQALIGGVGVSHFGLIPQEMAPALNSRPATPAVGGGGATGARGAVPISIPGGTGGIGASLRLAGDALIVFKVDSAGPAFKAGVRAGDEVVRIDEVDMNAALAQLGKVSDKSVARQARVTAVSRANSSLGGRVGDTVVLGIQSGAKVQNVAIARAPVRGTMSRVGNLPALNAVLDVSERSVPGSSGPRRVGVLAFSVWLPVLTPEIDAAFAKLRDVDGLVIDLRGNPGGFALMVSLVAGHMLDSAYGLGTFQQRTVTLRLNANPQARPFRGPVAVIIDRLSGSTSEFFAAGLQAIGRARIVGDTSAGAALPAILERLPNGDVMMHATADLVDPSGRRLEGKGVVPDDVVPLSVVSLAAGRDDAMTAALRWVAAQPIPHKD